MPRSDDNGAIKTDYDRVSRANFPKTYTPPQGITFAHSDALFPPPELRAVLLVEFEKQCRILCFGPIPTWDDVLARLEALRSLPFKTSSFRHRC